MRYKYPNLNKLRPELFFVFLASIFGLIILFITPPFQSPDEINHFYRAYQISEGHFIAVKQDNRVGGYIPVSMTKITEPFLSLCWNIHSKTSFKTIIEQFKVPLEQNKQKFMDFPNTVVYSPVSYVPQSISIFILRKFNLPPLFIFYGARLFALFWWIFSIFIALKLIPFFKWSLVLIVLLPMSIFINMSISADVATNSLSFILIAYLLKLAYLEQNISLKQFITTAFIAVLLALSKLVYIPIILLFLLIPKEKFHSKKNYYLQLIGLFGVCFGVIMAWAKIMNTLYLPYSFYNIQYRDNANLVQCADMYQQMHYILNHGIYLLQVFVNSMNRTFDMYFQGYIGTFGWLETKLPMWFIYLSYILLCIVALADRNENIRIKPHHKLLFLTGFLIIICLVMLSQHLTWDCIGGDFVPTIQGRYFIPAFPLLFLLFYSSGINYTKIVVPVVIIFSFLSLSFTTHTLYKRYYVAPQFKSIVIKCDAENISSDNYFLTDNPSVFLDNPRTQTKEKTRSGMSSVKLTPKNQYGFTYRFYNCGLGDIINVDVWRYGTGGGIVITGGGDDFHSNAKPIEQDSKGWEHLQLSYTLSNFKNKEIGVCLYYCEKDSAYFDDITIAYHKFH